MSFFNKYNLEEPNKANIFDNYYFDESNDILYVDLPGANKDNVEILYSKSVDKLTIKAEVQLGVKKKIYSRSFYGFNIYDLEKSEYEFKDGIFILKLSKKETVVLDNKIIIKY